MRDVGKTAVLLDRHPLWLDAMSGLLASVGVEVVARATDCETATAMLEDYRPDVFVAGIDPSDVTQIDCVREAALNFPKTRSIVVGDSNEPSAIAASFAAGATVYCTKTAKQEDLLSAVRQTFERSIYVAPDSAAMGSKPVESARPATVSHDLTRRELEILRLTAEGYSNSQLARMLWVTEQTVKFHLSNIYRKLQVANRTEASRWAQRNGLLAVERDEVASASAVA